MQVQNLHVHTPEGESRVRLATGPGVGSVRIGTPVGGIATGHRRKRTMLSSIFNIGCYVLLTVPGNGLHVVGKIVMKWWLSHWM